MTSNRIRYRLETETTTGTVGKARRTVAVALLFGATAFMGAAVATATPVSEAVSEAVTGIVAEARGQQPEGAGTTVNGPSLSELTHEAVGELGFRAPAVEDDLPLIREQSDPVLRARMRIRRARREIALRQTLDAAAKAPRNAKPQDPSTEISEYWRFSIGNNGNWSPYPDRELDARNLSFPMRRDSRADKRSDQQRALDQIRRQNR